MRSHEHVMKTSEEFYEWAKSSSGLHTPLKSFEEKSGRGIFRRFFYFIPVKGPGGEPRQPQNVQVGQGQLAAARVRRHWCAWHRHDAPRGMPSVRRLLARRTP
jgi:hypothetical protein